VSTLEIQPRVPGATGLSEVPQTVAELAASTHLTVLPYAPKPVIRAVGLRAYRKRLIDMPDLATLTESESQPWGVSVDRTGRELAFNLYNIYIQERKVTLNIETW
jgi:hypothetical protein